MSRFLLIFLVISTLSTPTNATKKLSVPLWLRREHHQEEMGWCRMCMEWDEEPDPLDVEYLAIVIFCEAGADAQCDDTRYMVGDVALNRVADPRYPDTIYDVLTQKLQYGRFYWTGIVWPERASYKGNAAAVQRARDIAYNLLSNTKHSDLYGNGYIYQDCRVQGRDNVWSDGICFGR